MVSPLLSESCECSTRLNKFILGHNSSSIPAKKTAGHIYFFFIFIILLLQERKFLNIIPAVAEMSAATFVSLGLMFCALQSKLAPPRQAPELCAVFSTHGAELRSLSC
jgi:hypothetical protein